MGEFFTVVPGAFLILFGAVSECGACWISRWAVLGVVVRLMVRFGDLAVLGHRCLRDCVLERGFLDIVLGRALERGFLDFVLGRVLERGCLGIVVGRVLERRLFGYRCGPCLRTSFVDIVLGRLLDRGFLDIVWGRP